MEKTGLRRKDKAMKTVANKLNKLFFETKMTWLRVILLAVGSAVLTAAVLLIPPLAKTSASYLGVTPEAWFVFALIIVMNCEKPLEAAIKTFVFFLISQPLIYLLQVPFFDRGWEIFMYYPYWLKITVLTLPGAVVAWFVKKDNILSALVLSVATGFIGAVLASAAVTVLYSFPGELIRTVFCLLEILVFIFVLLKNKRGRILCAVITLVIFAAVGYIRLGGHIGSVGVERYRASYELPVGHTWEIKSTDGQVGQIEVVEDRLEILANRYSYETVIVVNELGEELELYMTYDPVQGLEIVRQ